jgi:6-phosphogluconolactonase
MRSDFSGRREFLAGLAAMAGWPKGRSPFAQPRPARAAGARPEFMYVGSFTSQGRGHGEGLSVYRRTRESDSWTQIQLVKELADPSFVIIDRQGRHLYSAHGDGTEATSYQIDPATGRLTVLNQQPTGGGNGVHLAIDATGGFLALVNYATGSLAVFPINADGSLAARSDLATFAGAPGPHRTQQERSHPHHCPFDRSGRFIVVPDKGLDKIFVYRLDAARGTLLPANPSEVATRAGAGPRHVDFHPALPFAYVVNELDSTIATYQFDPARGLLKPIQVITTLPTTFTGNNTGAEIAVAPSGRFLYASNRGHDSIAIFTIDRAAGTLAPVGWEPTQGRTPRFFALDPSGTELYAANQTTDTVVMFRVNQTTGTLARSGPTIAVATPSTIAFR